MSSLVPQYLPTSRGRLFSVLHQPNAAPRALLLICAPFFHEHARSYRLFSVLGHALANAGIAVLRFDYLGTGDSDGDDDQFSLAGACVDTAIAADWLQMRWPHAPLSIMGVRGGGHPALQAIQPTHRRLLWQPILDWAQYVHDLEQLDAGQREAAPDLDKGDPSDSLMGFRCSDALRAQLRNLPPPTAHDVVLLLAPDTAPASVEERLQVPLPPALAQWSGEVDMAQFPSRAIAALAKALEPHLVPGPGAGGP